MFIFEPGCFEAEGVLDLSTFSDPVPFLMKWHIFAQDAGVIECCQEIKMKNFAEILYNQFTFSAITENSFCVVFENINLGTIEGRGVREEHFIGWEFRNLKIDYEGYEYYERNNSGGYTLSAAYTSSDLFRTEIRGILNRKTVEQVL